MLVVGMILALQNGLKLVLDEWLAQRRNTVDKHLAVPMGRLIQHNAGGKNSETLLMLLQVLIEIVDYNPVRTFHAFINTGD